MTIENDNLSLCYSMESIEERLDLLACALTQQYAQERVVALCVLKGAFMFFSDLVRKLRLPNLELDFIGLSSYGNGSESSGCVTVKQWIATDVTDAHVIIVEDIVDSGRSMHMLLEKMKALNAKSVTLCVLLDKTSRREYEVPVHYSCFQV